MTVEGIDTGKRLQLQVGAVEGALGAYPVAAAVGIVGQGVDQWLGALAEGYLPTAEIESGDGALEQPSPRGKQGVDIAAIAVAAMTQVDDAQLGGSLAGSGSARSSGGTGPIGIGIEVEGLQTVACGKIEHIGLLRQSIYTRIGHRTVAEMAIAVVPVVAEESGIGTYPHQALTVLHDGVDGLRSVERDVGKPLCMERTTDDVHEYKHANMSDSLLHIRQKYALKSTLANILARKNQPTLKVTVFSILRAAHLTLTVASPACFRLWTMSTSLPEKSRMRGWVNDSSEVASPLHAALNSPAPLTSKVSSSSASGHSLPSASSMLIVMKARS